MFIHYKPYVRKESSRRRMIEYPIELLQHVPHRSHLHAYSAVQLTTNSSHSTEALEGTATARGMRACRKDVVLAVRVRLPGRPSAGRTLVPHAGTAYVVIARFTATPGQPAARATLRGLVGFELQTVSGRADEREPKRTMCCRPKRTLRPRIRTTSRVD